jgi:hypothetical protein
VSPSLSYYTGLALDPKGFIYAAGGVAGSGVRWIGIQPKYAFYVFGGNVDLKEEEDGDAILVRYLQ